MILCICKNIYVIFMDLEYINIIGNIVQFKSDKKAAIFK